MANITRVIFAQSVYKLVQLQDVRLHKSRLEPMCQLKDLVKDNVNLYIKNLDHLVHNFLMLKSFFFFT